MKYKITIVGVGNGGQAMAGHFAILGHDVTIYGRNLGSIPVIMKQKGILLKEKINGFGRIKMITDNLKEAINGANIIMVVTTADAHKEIAQKIAPFLETDQIIILNPGRTLGALEFKIEVEKYTKTRVYIAEAQSLIYACRAEGNGEVRILGVKSIIPLAALPSSDTDHVLSAINDVYHCFVKADNVLETGLENIGAIFHPALVLFNAATIERGECFYFYNDLTPAIADFLEKLDNERMAIGKAFGFSLLTASEWVSHSYSGINGTSLCDKMRNNPAYFKIMSPLLLESRLIMEDIPTGVLPLIELSRLVNVETPLLTAVFITIQALVNERFEDSGRTLKNLGINQSDYSLFLKMIE